MSSFFTGITAPTTADHGPQPVSLTQDWMKDNIEAQPSSARAQALKERLSAIKKREFTKAELEEKLARA